jgi:hypothetical protein
LQQAAIINFAAMTLQGKDTGCGVSTSTPQPSPDALQILEPLFEIYPE